jgi:spermidine synthase
MPWQTSRSLLFAAFVLSGLTGLIYESMWTHYLKLYLGHAAFAQSLVLAIFMGGMALGGWLSSVFGPRFHNLLRAYAVAEALIGLYALAFHPLFQALESWSTGSVIPALASPQRSTCCSGASPCCSCCRPRCCSVRPSR